MILMTRSADGTENLTLAPWVRVVRHEPARTKGYLGDLMFALDVVHIDFLAEYLRSHLFAFAREFATSVRAHDQVLAAGKGFASGLGANSWTDIEPRLRERKFSDDARRGRSTIHRLAQFLTGNMPED
ncbi:MAG: hypothetical protein IIA90_00780 [Chloroflexi bacterium]|nr:hypothetical protein [Chloroflexota bacterium]